jgi:hypothetical protein
LFTKQMREKCNHVHNIPHFWSWSEQSYLPFED